eukprot:1152710-Pelagomonas_calceolata.AAC.2
MHNLGVFGDVGAAAQLQPVPPARDMTQALHVVKLAVYVKYTQNAGTPRCSCAAAASASCKETTLAGHTARQSVDTQSRVWWRGTLTNYSAQMRPVLHGTFGQSHPAEAEAVARLEAEQKARSLCVLMLKHSLGSAVPLWMLKVS